MLENIGSKAALASVMLLCSALPSLASHSLSEMTLEEKVGQLLMVHFNGEEANEEAKRLIQKVHVGGIIYYSWANGLRSPEQVRNLSLGLQRLALQNRMPLPLFIAVDQEGGAISRLKKGFTSFPSNKDLGLTGDVELAEQCAQAVGQELRAVGINFNLAPVVDVNSNPRNPVIGVRSFGDSTDIVVPFAKSMLRGYRKEGIISCLKHFPGHGDVEVDSHQDLPVINKSKEQLQSTEFLPFSELAGQADTIMTGHILVPSIDPARCATLSKNALDILRKEFGFQGVIISDSLVMQGLLKQCASVDEAAMGALNAGCDLLLLGGKQLNGTDANFELTVADVERIHQTLVRAVKEGMISEPRLNESVQRIVDLKNSHPLSPEHEGDWTLLVNTPEHRLLSEKISSLTSTW